MHAQYSTLSTMLYCAVHRIPNCILPVIGPNSSIGKNHEKDIGERRIVNRCHFTVDEARIRRPECLKELVVQGQVFLTGIEIIVSHRWIQPHLIDVDIHFKVVSSFGNG